MLDNPLKSKAISYLSSLTPSSQLTVKDQELECYKKAQNLSYQCAVAISKEIKDGWTETQTASLMDTYLKDHGVKLLP